MYGESIDGRPFDVVLAHDWVEKSCNKNFFEAVKIFLGLEIKNYNIPWPRSSAFLRIQVLASWPE